MVLAHEIGHTLGLTHSPAPRALMAPYYKKLGRDALLSWDDVLAVQSLYGEPLGSSDSGSSIRISPPPPLFSSLLPVLPYPEAPKAPLKSEYPRVLLSLSIRSKPSIRTNLCP